MRLALAAVGLVVLAAGAAWGQGRQGPGGEEPRVDLLTAQLTFKNIGSRVDGKGMCVTTAVEYCLRWAGLEEWRGFRDWSAQFPGGGHPSKLDELMQRYAREKGLADPRGLVLQVQGATGPVLEWAQRTRRPVAITDCGDPRRYGRDVAHMTTAVHYGPAWRCIVDNNAPLEEAWVQAAEFERRHRWRDYAWAVVVLAPPPPPIPRPRAAAWRGRNMVPMLLATLVTMQPPCVDGRCPVPAAFRGVPPGLENYCWQWSEAGSQWLLLDQQERQLGCWDPARRQFYWLHGGRLIAGEAPLPAPDHVPVQAPAAVGQPPGGVRAGQAEREFLTGVDVAHLQQVPRDQVVYRLGGEEGPAPPAAIGFGDPREDDSRHCHVVVAHPDAAERGRAVDLIRSHPEWERLRPYVTLHSREPRHWHLADVGIGGPERLPGITVLGPYGERDDQAEAYCWVDLRQPLAVEQRDEVIDATIEAVRKTNPAYHPAAKPRVAKGDGAEWLLIVAVSVVLFLLVLGVFGVISLVLWVGPHSKGDQACGSG